MHGQLNALGFECGDGNISVLLGLLLVILIVVASCKDMGAAVFVTVPDKRKAASK